MLQHHIDRLRRAGLPVYLATTSNASDHPIAAYAEAAAIPCFRGDEQNVLRRYYGCAKAHGLDIIVRVTSDCPLIDGSLIAEAVEQYLAAANENLYLSNVLERTFPRGFDFEVFSFKLLEDAFLNATQPGELEHVTPYINQNRSGVVQIQHISRQQEDASQFRVTLDTPEDLRLITCLIEHHQADRMNGEDIIAFLETRPQLSEINAHIEQKKTNLDE